MGYPDFSYGISGKVWAGIFVVAVVVALAMFLTAEEVITTDQAYIISGVTIAIFILAFMRTRSRQPL